MAEQHSFQDPLEDIDPVMKDAFSGTNPIQLDNTASDDDDDDDDFNDAPFQQPIPVSRPMGMAEPVAQPAPTYSSAPDFDYDDDEDDDFDLFDDEDTGSFLDETDAHSGFDAMDSSSHNISDVQFPSLNSGETGNKIETDVFSNIPVSLSVELGRSKISLKEVFELTEGSIVELDRLVGEPLDLVVNGQVVAQGEVVAIDNNYGLRVTRVTAAPKG